MIDRSTWPTDERFRRFAAVVADGVQLAISRGQTIGFKAVSGCSCPLGTLTSVAFPSPERAKKELAQLLCGLVPGACYSFIEGYETEGAHHDSSTDAYYRLGRAYREWAMGRAGA
jgi:hypothetical protein